MADTTVYDYWHPLTVFTAADTWSHNPPLHEEKEPERYNIRQENRTYFRRTQYRPRRMYRIMRAEGQRERPRNKLHHARHRSK